MKSIMRLILALAAHFKPNSVRQTAQYDKTVAQGRLQSVAGIAQVSVGESGAELSTQTVCVNATSPKLPSQA